jgi:hypothetical protein
MQLNSDASINEVYLKTDDRKVCKILYDNMNNSTNQLVGYLPNCVITQPHEVIFNDNNGSSIETLTKLSNNMYVYIIKISFNNNTLDGNLTTYTQSILYFHLIIPLLMVIIIIIVLLWKDIFILYLI